MARIAFIMDRIFRKFGLSGNFIPMLVGSGTACRALWQAVLLKMTATVK